MSSQVSFQALVSGGRQAPSLDCPEFPLQINAQMDVACFHQAMLVVVRQHGMQARRWLQEFLPPLFPFWTQPAPSTAPILSPYVLPPPNPNPCSWPLPPLQRCNAPALLPAAAGTLPPSRTPARTHPSTYPHCRGMLAFRGAGAMRATAAGSWAAPVNIAG